MREKEEAYRYKEAFHHLVETLTIFIILSLVGIIPLMMLLELYEDISKLLVANKLYSYIHCELKRKWNPIEGADIVWEPIMNAMYVKLDGTFVPDNPFPGEFLRDGWSGIFLHREGFLVVVVSSGFWFTISTLDFVWQQRKDLQEIFNMVQVNPIKRKSLLIMQKSLKSAQDNQPSSFIFCGHVHYFDQNSYWKKIDWMIGLLIHPSKKRNLWVRECPSSSIQNIKGNYKTEADRQDSTSSKDDSKFKTKLKCVDEPFTIKGDISTQSALRNTAETKSVAFLGFKHTGTQNSKTVIDIDQHFHLMFGREKILKIEIVDKAVRFSKDGKDS
ncbi:hypothetical protein YC2023_008211 [Brassica napus]